MLLYVCHIKALMLKGSSGTGLDENLCKHTLPLRQQLRGADNLLQRSLHNLLREAIVISCNNLIRLFVKFCSSSLTTFLSKLFVTTSTKFLLSVTKFTQRFLLLACQTNHSMSSLTLCQKANLTLPKRLIRFVAGILGVCRTDHKI